jgi:molecular chaperone GrpE
MASGSESDQTPIAEEVPETERLQPETERLQEELARERDMRLRALADYDNYRKRIERERVGAAQAGKREIVLKLLELADNFERAFRHSEEVPASWVEGMHSVQRQLMELLKSQGVTPFESLGQPFDPKLHEAIGDVESDRYEPGTVAEELQRGYRWGDTLLRPARVRVAR